MQDNNELYEYRSKLLARTVAATREFCTFCRQVDDPHRPLNAEGWSTHQIAAHVRDVDKQVYGKRLRRAVAEEHPTFQNFDGDAWLRENYSANEPLEKILAEFETSIHALVGWLSSLAPTDWSRLTRHEVYGEFAMQSWAERGLAHIEEHIRVIEAAHPVQG